LADPATVPPAHLTVLTTPSICNAVGIYGVDPWLIIIVTVIALLFVVGIFVKFAVKLVVADE
jgi:hypothetical protein